MPNISPCRQLDIRARLISLSRSSHSSSGHAPPNSSRLACGHCPTDTLCFHFSNTATPWPVVDNLSPCMVGRAHTSVTRWTCLDLSANANHHERNEQGKGLDAYRDCDCEERDASCANDEHTCACDRSFPAFKSGDEANHSHDHHHSEQQARQFAIPVNKFGVLSTLADDKFVGHAAKPSIQLHFDMRCGVPMAPLAASLGNQF
eukprot:scaffold15730_cov65-Phaeocystis_antarctica.AAC.8